MPKGVPKNQKRAKRAKGDKVPSVKQALNMSQAQIQGLKATTQRKLAVELSKAGTKRLRTIQSNLNKRNLRPAHIADSEVLQNRLSETTKGWKVEKKFATSGLSTKSEYEEYIQEVVLFLRSPISTVTGLKKRKVAQQEELIKLYNKVMGYDEDDENYLTSLSQRAFDDYGRVINALRKNHELLYGWDSPEYVKNMQKAAEIVTTMSHQEIDDFVHNIEVNVEAEQKRHKMEKEEEQARLKSHFGNRTIRNKFNGVII